MSWIVKKIGPAHDYVIVHNTSTKQEKTVTVRGAVSAVVNGEELHVKRKDGCLEIINMKTQGRRTVT